MNYTSFILLEFDAENRDDMYNRIFALEKLLEDNDYQIKQHHTMLTDKMRSVRYGRQQ